MIRIRKKKKCCDTPCTEDAHPTEASSIESNAFFAGAFPGKPWDRLTDTRHARRSTIKILNDDEQREAVRIARHYFGFDGDDFPRARQVIQRILDDPQSAAALRFFGRAIVTEKRIAIRAYLSDAAGRFIPHDMILPLLKNIANAGLDFEVGAIDHYIDGERKTELVVGDGTEVISETGYWFAHTHPAKSGVTNNVLPSTADLDVMIATARSLANNLRKTKLVNHVLRDIGTSRVAITTSIGPQPSSATIEHVVIEYHMPAGDITDIEQHGRALLHHLRMRHGLAANRIELHRSDAPLE